MRRTLSLFDVVCLGINAIVGSGIFLLPDDLYRKMGVFSPLAFLLVACGLMPVAICYAALARGVNRTGGPYVYTQEMLGKGPAYWVGVLSYANAVFSFAAVASAFGATVVRSLHGTAENLWLTRGAAWFMVLVFSWLNLRGVKPVSRLIALFTSLKFLILLLVGFALLPSFWSGSSLGAEPAPEWDPRGAVFMALFALQGFEVVGVPAGETKNPERNVPLAVLLSLFLTGLLYVWVQVALSQSGSVLLQPTDTPLSDALAERMPQLASLALAGGLLSTLGFLSGTAFGTPRYLFAMAQSGEMPARLSALDPRRETPAMAIALTLVLVLLCTAFLDYRSLIGVSNVAVAVQYAAVCGAAWKLDRRSLRERQPRPFPLGPFLPGLGIAVSLWILTEASLLEFGWALGALGLGYLCRQKGQGPDALAQKG